jgi:hypothetical protein
VIAQSGMSRRVVDAVDWVERIPLAETRNYDVQRVMENLQVYSVRLGASFLIQRRIVEIDRTLESAQSMLSKKGRDEVASRHGQVLFN